MVTEDEIRQLQHGDIIRHGDGNAYVVIANDGKRVTAVRSITVGNPIEWTIVEAAFKRRALLLERLNKVFDLIAGP